MNRCLDLSSAVSNQRKADTEQKVDVGSIASPRGAWLWH